jgi:hypothetical protein
LPLPTCFTPQCSTAAGRRAAGKGGRAGWRQQRQR